MQEYKVKLITTRSVVVTVTSEANVHPIRVEDMAADLYYRGDVTFPEGSPGLRAEIVSGLSPEREFLTRISKIQELLSRGGGPDPALLKAALSMLDGLTLEAAKAVG